MENLVGGRPIEIIGIDHAEGTIQFVPRHPDGMPGSPWFGALRWNGKPRRQIVQFLVRKRRNEVERLLEMLAQHRFELRLGENNDFPESRPERVVDGVIDDHFPTGTDGINLLETAVAAADSGG